MSLVSFLPPLPPPLHTSQLTETWQWPTCMCWQPKWSLLFWSHLLGLGKILPPTSFPPLKSFWDPVLPCASRAGSAVIWDARANPSALGHPDSSAVFLLAFPSPGVTLLPTSLQVQWWVSQGWAGNIILEQLQKESAISCLIGSHFPCPNTRAGWPLLPSVTLPCFAGAGVGVCNLLCITCTVSLSYLSTGCFS